MYNLEWDKLAREVVVKSRLVPHVAKREYGLDSEREPADWQIQSSANRTTDLLANHPAILAVLKDHKPKDFHLLALEMPIISTVDNVRVAYFRNEAQQTGWAKANIFERHTHQTVTTAARYIKRHFPQLKDHEIQKYGNIVSAFEFSLTDDMEEILEVLTVGPYSCMAIKDDDDWNFYLDDTHPYEVYDKKLGWKLAVGRKDGKVISRALVNSSNMTFVRSYGFADSTDYVQRHEPLEAWLEQQGYEHNHGWEDGLKMSYIKGQGSDPYMPYLDGENQTVSIYGEYVIIDCSGNYTADNTDGTVDEKEPDPECDMCYDSQECLNYVEATEQNVCDSCLENHFVEARTGRRGRWGFTNMIVANDDAVDVFDCDDDIIKVASDCLDECDVIEDVHGDLRFSEDCTFFEDEWYPAGDIADAELECLNGYSLVSIDGELYHTNDELIEWCKVAEVWKLADDEEDDEDEDTEETCETLPLPVTEQDITEPVTEQDITEPVTVSPEQANPNLFTYNRITYNRITNFTQPRFHIHASSVE